MANGRGGAWTRTHRRREMGPSLGVREADLFPPLRDQWADITFR